MTKSTRAKKKVISQKTKSPVKKVRRVVSDGSIKKSIVKKIVASPKRVAVSETQILMAVILLLLITGCSLLAFPLL